MSERRRAGTLLGLIGAACLVLQSFVVPLHLVLFEHDPFREPEGHVHSHASVPHGHAAHGEDHNHARHAPAHEEGDDGAEGGHAPHPFEDHFERLAEPVLPPPSFQLFLAPPPALAGQLAFDLRSPERPRVEAEGPRPPPPRRTAAPRAPPILV